MVGFSFLTGGAFFRHPILRIFFGIVWLAGMFLLAVLYVGVAVGTPMYGIPYAAAGVAIFAPWIFGLGCFITCLTSGGAGTVLVSIVLNNLLLFTAQFFTFLGAIFYWSFSSRIFWYCAAASDRLGSVDLAVCRDELWLEYYTWIILGIIVPLHALALCLCVIIDSVALVMQARKIPNVMRDAMVNAQNLAMLVARGGMKPWEAFPKLFAKGMGLA